MANFCYALVYAGKNDMVKPFKYLEKANEERTGPLIFLDMFRSLKLIPSFSNNSQLVEYIEQIGVPHFNCIENSTEQKKK